MIYKIEVDWFEIYRSRIDYLGTHRNRVDWFGTLRYWTGSLEFIKVHKKFKEENMYNLETFVQDIYQSIKWYNLKIGIHKRKIHKILYGLINFIKKSNRLKLIPN